MEFVVAVLILAACCLLALPAALYVLRPVRVVELAPPPRPAPHADPPLGPEPIVVRYGSRTAADELDHLLAAPVDHTEHRLVPVVAGGLLLTSSLCTICETEFGPTAWLEQGDRLHDDLDAAARTWAKELEIARRS